MKWRPFVVGAGLGLLVGIGVAFVPGVRYHDTVLQLDGKWPLVVRHDRLTDTYSIRAASGKEWRRFEDVVPPGEQ